MATIQDIRAREIIDPRGNPTVEADVMIDSGVVREPPCRLVHRPAVGRRLSCVMPIKRYRGKGVKQAIRTWSIKFDWR